MDNPLSSLAFLDSAELRRTMATPCLKTSNEQILLLSNNNINNLLTVNYRTSVFPVFRCAAYGLLSLRGWKFWIHVIISNHKCLTRYVIMLLTEDSGIGDYHINAYGPDSVTVNKVTYTSSLLVSPYRLVPEWGPRSLDQLGGEHIKLILALGPEIVILGTGQNFKWSSKTQLAQFHQRRIGVECMDTGAACRTYIALMSEGRKVVAALLIG